MPLRPKVVTLKQTKQNKMKADNITEALPTASKAIRGRTVHATKEIKIKATCNKSNL